MVNAIQIQCNDYLSKCCYTDGSPHNFQVKVGDFDFEVDLTEPAKNIIPMIKQIYREFAVLIFFVQSAKECADTIKDKDTYEYDETAKYFVKFCLNMYRDRDHSEKPRNGELNAMMDFALLPEYGFCLGKTQTVYNNHNKEQIQQNRDTYKKCGFKQKNIT